jgi:hypothetical protein
MANGIFEVYRQHYSKMSSQLLRDGEVVFKAADWHQFIDPDSRVALVSVDLENLGAQRDFTRRKIVQCLKGNLEAKRIPFMIQWIHNYILATESDDDVVSLDQVKAQASESARKAIRQVIDFCGGEGILAEGEEKPESKPLSWREKLWQHIFGKSHKDE